MTNESPKSYATNSCFLCISHCLPLFFPFVKKTNCLVMQLAIKPQCELLLLVILVQIRSTVGLENMGKGERPKVIVKNNRYEEKPFTNISLRPQVEPQ